MTTWARKPSKEEALKRPLQVPSLLPTMMQDSGTLLGTLGSRAHVAAFCLMPKVAAVWKREEARTLPAALGQQQSTHKVRDMKHLSVVNSPFCLLGIHFPECKSPIEDKKERKRIRRDDYISYFLCSLLSLCLSTLRQVKIPVRSNSIPSHLFLQSIWPEQQAKQRQDQQYHLVSAT